MKRHSWFWIAFLAAALVVPGCAKKEEINTAKLEAAFQSASTDLQALYNEAVVAIQTADYAEALKLLNKLAANVQLTPEQKQAVLDMIEQVKKVGGAAVSDASAAANKAAQDAGKAAEGATKALDDAKKLLPK